MATTTQTSKDVNDQLIGLGRQAGSSLVDAYETTFNTVADYTDKVADAARVEWVASAARAQASLTREITRIQVATARDLLK